MYLMMLSVSPNITPSTYIESHTQTHTSLYIAYRQTEPVNYEWNPVTWRVAKQVRASMCVHS